MRHTYATPLILLVLLALAGCTYLGSLRPSPATTQSTPPTPTAPYLEKTIVLRHEETQDESAVDTALDWAERHAVISEKLIQAQKDNHQWEAQNQQLKTQLAEIQAELDQTQKELTAANAMLVEFRSELTNWKKDVIGNRREIDYQHKVEMEALYKILKFLGGEIPETPLASAAPAAPATTAAPALEELPSEAQK